MHRIGCSRTIADPIGLGSSPSVTFFFLSPSPPSIWGGGGAATAYTVHM